MFPSEISSILPSSELLKYVVIKIEMVPDHWAFYDFVTVGYSHICRL